MADGAFGSFSAHRVKVNSPFSYRIDEAVKVKPPYFKLCINALYTLSTDFIFPQITTSPAQYFLI